MEDVLDVYARAHDPDIPVVCMDEKPYQLLDYTRDSIDATPGRVRKEDYEYSRKGVCSIFVWSQPLAGRRRVHARPRRTRVDWAHEMKTLLTVDCPDAEQARALANRLEIHYTPKHGSWLNIAEIELSALSRQCLSRRIPDIDTLNHELGRWQDTTNADQRPVNWQFTTTDARIKLRHLYPEH